MVMRQFNYNLAASLLDEKVSGRHKDPIKRLVFQLIWLNSVNAGNNSYISQ